MARSMSRIVEKLSPGPYGDLPGWKEPTTSRDAAESVKGGSAAARAEIFKIIARSPATADEVAAAIGWTILYVRPRIAEMRALGLIVPSGARRPNESGRSAIVWRVNA